MFIIIAILLVAAVAFYILLRGKITEIIPSNKPAENINRYISECVEDSVREKLVMITEQGGFASPELYINHSGIKVAYLCYNNLYYSPCINQAPHYINHLEREIKNSISQDVENCFTTLSEDYQQKSVGITTSETESTNVELLDKKIIVTIKKEVMINDRDETKQYNDFKTIINSPLYNLARTAMEIVFQEATFCHAEYLGYQTLYPWVEISVSDIKSHSRVYKIVDKNTGTKLNMAVRSCAIPMGLG